MSPPRPSQKKQASLTSFFTPKSGAALSSSPVQASPSLPSRKRPLEEDRDRGNDTKKKRAEAVAVGDAAAKKRLSKRPSADEENEPAVPSSPLRSSGRTERYLYGGRGGQAEGGGGGGEDGEDNKDNENEEDDETTTRKKEELHRKFVKKLGHPDSLPRRRNWILGEEAAGGRKDSSGDGEEEEEEEEEERPAKGKKKGKLTPMEVQFLEIKRQHMDTVLVVEVGYKFKFFGEDARTAARTLGIVCIPGKVRYDEDASEAHLDRFASASIPVPRLGVHVKRLVAAGHKVGVVRQMETAALKKAGDNRNAPFVRRLTSVYTKGTYIDEAGELEASSGPKVANTAGGYLLCLAESRAQGSGTDEKVEVGVLAVQPATGDILYDRFEDGFMRSELETRLLHISPCELLIVGELSWASEKLVQHLSGSAANVFGDRTRVERVAKRTAADAQSHVTQFYAGLDSSILDTVLQLPAAVTACLSAMITHLAEYGLEHIFALTKYFASFTTRQHMLLSGTTLESLEVYRNATDHGLRGSLLWALDKTQTRFGHRLLRKWIGRPLLDRAALEARVAAVAELRDAADSPRRDRLERLLGQTKTDLERSLIRIYYGKCTRPELVAVLQTLQRIANASNVPDGSFASPLLADALAALPAIGPLVEGFLDEINGEAARQDDKYAFFREAAETDDISNHKVGIAAVEMDLDEQRASIGATLQRKTPPPYVTVAGIEYLVEVAHADLRRVPASWIKISGTKRLSRFHTPAVVRLVRARDQHKEALAAACDAAFAALLQRLAARYQPLRDAVAAVAALDALLSLARVAALPGYVRPTLLPADAPPALHIRGGRHPVAEHTLPGGYIPFSSRLGGEPEPDSSDSPRALLITGPNMGGKSSFVRAVALLTLLAQIGSFVPADAMALTLADAIFTRMGARDNLFAGESTFMVEVSETAAILRAATPRSLVVLDELGRGTSTHDGAAIAHAVLAHLAQHTRCLTLFITHYQSLGRVAAGLHPPGIVQNVHMAFTANKDNDSQNEEITFLYEVAPGMAHRSYGLNVARLARMPQPVLDLAAQKSREMEHDVRTRRLQAAVRLATHLLSEPTAAADQLDQLVASIEQL